MSQQPRVQAPNKVYVNAKSRAMKSYWLHLVTNYTPQLEMVIKCHTRDIPGFQGAGYHTSALLLQICGEFHGRCHLGIDVV